ncbi:site-specific DNA-methyltransferase [Deltaproteobacteria bacterium]|nr:site-specific DNA-methyltransferase [Deltaproteobacteria bacterium]
MQSLVLRLGDCVERMKELRADSIGASVCDPPYGISFMSKEWDNISEDVQMQQWHVLWLLEAYRVLEPGGVIKVFSGTRTFHRLAVAMTEAGFLDLKIEAWAYGSGFPKSLNVSKAMDKMHGAKRKMKRVPFTGNALLRSGGQNTRPWMEEALAKGYHELPDDSPVTDDAKMWAGWGTALKPSWEPVLVGRKPDETAYRE